MVRFIRFYHSYIPSFESLSLATLIADGNFGLQTLLLGLIYWDLLWFHTTPSFMDMVFDYLLLFVVVRCCDLTTSNQLYLPISGIHRAMPNGFLSRKMVVTDNFSVQFRMRKRSGGPFAISPMKGIMVTILFDCM